MRVMGLDLSTKAGVSIVDTAEPRHVLFAGTVTFPKLTAFPRVNAIAGQILALHETYKPAFTVIEDYAVSKFGGSAITSIEIGTVVRFLFWQEGYEFLDISPSTLKKFVTGKGNAPKDMMAMHVLKKFGHEAKSDDEADAVALGMLGLLCAGRVSYNALDKEVMKSCYEQNPDFTAPGK